MSVTVIEGSQIKHRISILNNKVDATLTVPDIIDNVQGDRIRAPQPQFCSQVNC